jgi:hypothetical protein
MVHSWPIQPILFITLTIFSRAAGKLEQGIAVFSEAIGNSDNHEP